MKNLTTSKGPFEFKTKKQVIYFFQETTTIIPMRSKCSPHSEYHTRGSVLHSSRMRTLRSSNRQTTAPSSSASSTTTPANSNHHLNAKQASSSRSPSASTSRSSSKASSLSPRVVQVQIRLLEVFASNSVERPFRIFERMNLSVPNFSWPLCT